MSVNGLKFSKTFKERADLNNCTHEAWGGYGYYKKRLRSFRAAVVPQTDRALSKNPRFGNLRTSPTTKNSKKLENLEKVEKY